MASRLGARVVHDATEVLKSMMAGAHVAMMTSALLKYGIEHTGVVLAGIERWMEDHEYQSIKQMRGSLSLVNVIAKSVVTAACSSQIR